MSNIPVFLASDNNYAPFVASTIASICDNTKSYVDFYILDGGITIKNQDKICKLKDKFTNFSIEFIKVDVEKEFSELITAHHITKSMYNRLLIPNLKLNIDKAIYSDVDVIVLGDIAEMYYEDLENYPLGAIPEFIIEGWKNCQRKANLGLSSEHTYFRSGNLIIDCKQWRDKNILKNLLILEKKIQDKLISPDQDLLNRFFDCNYKKLPLKYCYTIYDHVNDPNAERIITHYDGKIKPWHIDTNLKTTMFPNFREFWYYLSLTPFYDEVNNAEKDKGTVIAMRMHRIKIKKMWENLKNAKG